MPELLRRLPLLALRREVAVVVPPVLLLPLQLGGGELEPRVHPVVRVEVRLQRLRRYRGDAGRCKRDVGGRYRGDIGEI